MRNIGVRAAPLKGLVIGPRLYGEPLDRPFGDVDVLVAPRDLNRVAAWAEGMGHAVVRDSTHPGTFNVVMRSGAPVDIRAYVGPRGFCRFPADEILDRAKFSSDPAVVSAPFLDLDPIDHLLILIVDALFDKFIDKSMPGQRATDLSLAFAAWAQSAEPVVARAYSVRLRRATATVAAWVADHTQNEQAAVIAASLTTSALDVLLRRKVLGVMTRKPWAWRSKLAARLLADSIPRAGAALAVGAAGTLALRARQRGFVRWWRSGPTTDAAQRT